MSLFILCQSSGFNKVKVPNLPATEVLTNPQSRKACPGDSQDNNEQEESDRQVASQDLPALSTPTRSNELDKTICQLWVGNCRGAGALTLTLATVFLSSSPHSGDDQSSHAFPCSHCSHHSGLCSSHHRSYLGSHASHHSNSRSSVIVILGPAPLRTGTVAANVWSLPSPGRSLPPGPSWLRECC